MRNNNATTVLPADFQIPLFSVCCICLYLKYTDEKKRKTKMERIDLDGFCFFLYSTETI